METNDKRKVAWSVLDLATVLEGKDAADSFANSLALAQHVEKLNYTRFWLAEHHNMPGVASSATPVLIGYIAGGTTSIRVGSGGVMLPNHSPLVVAEQFGTLASLYPDRIDLGLGRAPGTDQLTARALRGENFNAQFNFPADIQKLQRYFSAENSTSGIRAIPGEGLDIPIWILGSSTDSALLAAAMGLPYAFASHFAPTHFMQAIELYRNNFRPSQWLQEPYVISCVNVVAADTDAEADRLVTSVQQFIMGVVTGQRLRLQPPVDTMEGIWDAQVEAAVKHMLTYAFIGGPEKISRNINAFLEQTKVNEIMVTAHIYEQPARLHSYTLFADIMRQLNAQ